MISGYLLKENTIGGRLRPRRHFEPLPRLARLFGMAIGEFPDWEDEEFNAILLRQLDAPLKKWLRPNPSLFHSLAEDTSKSAMQQITSVRDLLSCSEPPLTYLRRAKEIAKAAETR